MINAFYFVTYVTDLHTPNTRMGSMAVAAAVVVMMMTMTICKPPGKWGNIPVNLWHIIPMHKMRYYKSLLK